MSEVVIKNDEVDIVIGALQSDLTSFMEAWRPFFTHFHIVIVKDPDLNEELKIPTGFNLHVYKKSDIDKAVGPSKTGPTFSGYACRYFGYLVSRKKYIISVDDDCFPAKNAKGELVDPISQHIVNLSTPATPFFFNTLYDPYCRISSADTRLVYGAESIADSLAGYGLIWLISTLRNMAYVDAVVMVPARAMMPVSGINIAFNGELAGPALMPAKEGNFVGI